MGHPIQRIPKPDEDPQRRAADRTLLLTRIAIGLAHAVVAAIGLAGGGGRVLAVVEPRGAVGALEIRSDGGLGNREQALPHLDAARRLAPEAACELSIDTPVAGGARLSLSFLHRR